jgi:Ca2+-binding RTX toxin-like protein
MATKTGTEGNDYLSSFPEFNPDGTISTFEYLDGLGGNDTLDSVYGNETLNGGLGDDLYLLTYQGNKVLIDAGGVDTISTSTWRYELPPGFENLVTWGSWPEDGQGFGNELDNVIISKSVGLLLDGADGDDTLLGSDHGTYFECHHGSGDYGNDVITGGAGSDHLTVGKWSSAIIDFRVGTVTGGGKDGAGTVQFTSIERATGGSFDDVLIANDAGIRLYGNDGDDTLTGGHGEDVLSGEGDRDVLTGGNGNDLLYGGGDTDVLRGGGGDDEMYSDASSSYSQYISGGHELMWGGAGHDDMHGGEGEDTLVGGSGTDTLTGGEDADVLRGGAGNDHFFWDPDDKSIVGGGGLDYLHEYQADLDLRDVSNRMIRSIEVIDLTNPWSSSDNMLTLGERDILDMSPTDTLRVFGNIGDSVNIIGDFRDLGVSGDFRRYKVGAALLLVDTDITNVS